MDQASHGFTTREQWTKFFKEYSHIILQLNDASYDLVRQGLTSKEWIAKYRQNSADTRRAYQYNEEMLDRHVRYFTRGEGVWTREYADPLLATLFRFITRIQDLGLAYEIAESLTTFYGPLGDEVALMKCYTVKAFCYEFLDIVHLSQEVHENCSRARAVYERYFLELTPEEQSMGLSIYDLEFDRLNNEVKLGNFSPQVVDELMDHYEASIKAREYVLAHDEGYEFNETAPDFNYYMGAIALCLPAEMCTPQQAEVIYHAALQQYQDSTEKENGSEGYRVRVMLTLHMAEYLAGKRSQEEVLEELKRLMEKYASMFLKENGIYNQYSVEAVEAVELAVYNLTQGGKKEKKLYHEVLALFTEFFSTRPYTALVDYVCGTFYYSYIVTALPTIQDYKEILRSLLHLTMFRQVQTAIHSIMVGCLSREIQDSLIRERPELLVGQLGTRTVQEVQERQEEFREFLFYGALLHDIGKLLCSNVINAQSHSLGELEFKALKFHPVTGAEMLEKLPSLSAYHDIAAGHQKSYDGISGYPAEFDNTASKVRIFIDIITICDSLDAATDHLGRNYAAAKDFETVMGELCEGKGTRYSGVIVDMLEQDEHLQKKIRHLLGEGRQDVYYSAHKIMLEEARHPGRKNTHDWIADLRQSCLK